MLINGAGGSIGTIAIQLAKYYGADVTGVDRSNKLDMLHSIGADHVIDYTKKDFTSSGQTYDVIFDVVGKSSFPRSIRSLNPNGRYLLANPGLSQMIRSRWTSITSSKTVVVGLQVERQKIYCSSKNWLKQEQSNRSSIEPIHSNKWSKRTDMSKQDRKQET